MKRIELYRDVSNKKPFLGVRHLLEEKGKRRKV